MGKRLKRACVVLRKANYVFGRMRERKLLEL
jgi:hypothetical protein